jgi:hypothetical protein
MRERMKDEGRQETGDRRQESGVRRMNLEIHFYDF